VIDAAEETGVDASPLKLKWPNDVLLGPAKLAGILIETGSEQGELWMAAGFGVNIATAPEQPDRATACLANLPRGEGATPEQFLVTLDRTFRIRLAKLLAEGFGPTREDWLARAAHMGKRMQINPAAGPIAGVMAGLADDGALVLRLDDGREHYVRAGEISILG
jgi:BirA family biotin operon repressor/biotin-[acetyl-CoA-carboxylase] ligase